MVEPCHVFTLFSTCILVEYVVELGKACRSFNLMLFCSSNAYQGLVCMAHDEWPLAELLVQQSIGSGKIPCGLVKMVKYNIYSS